MPPPRGASSPRRSGRPAKRARTHQAAPTSSQRSLSPSGPPPRLGIYVEAANTITVAEMLDARPLSPLARYKAWKSAFGNLVCSTDHLTDCTKNLGASMMLFVSYVRSLIIWFPATRAEGRITMHINPQRALKRFTETTGFGIVPCALIVVGIGTLPL